MTRYLTTQEVAELCRTSPETVRYWAWRQTGPRSAKVGRRRLYAVEDVDRWLAAKASANPHDAA